MGAPVSGAPAEGVAAPGAALGLPGARVGVVCGTTLPDATLVTCPLAFAGDCEPPGANAVSPICGCATGWIGGAESAATDDRWFELSPAQAAAPTASSTPVTVSSLVQVMDLCRASLMPLYDCQNPATAPGTSKAGAPFAVRNYELPPENIVKIEVYSDVACPWCYLGERRLARALKKFPGRDDVDVVFRPFQLDPTTPERAAPLLDDLERKFGAHAREMTAQITETGSKEGIDFDFDHALAVNTFTAHRLLRLAEREYGADVQRDLACKLFEAHFEEGADVGDPGELTALAVEVGLDARRVAAYLASDEGVAETRAEIAAARELGITAVPTFVIDGQYAVQGAQPPEIFLQVLGMQTTGGGR